VAFAWATAICAYGKWPPTPNNVRGLNAWSDCEGGAKYNNPLNTSLHTSGVSGTQPGVNIPIYRSAAAGVAATVRTLNGGYNNATGALRHGNLGDELKNNATRIFSRNDGAHWGTDPNCVTRVLGGHVSAPGASGGVSATPDSSSSTGGVVGTLAAATGIGLTLPVVVVGLVLVAGIGIFVFKKRGK
jgi:hypothetical protein